MRFYVEGPDNEGVAHLEMVKDQRNKWEYKYLFVDIPGKQKSVEKKKCLKILLILRLHLLDACKS